MEKTPQEELEQTLNKKFWQFSNRVIYFEYDGQFTPPNFFTLEDGTKLSKLGRCHRSLGVLEGSIKSFDHELNQGFIQIDELEHPFTFHQKSKIPSQVDEWLGQVHRFTFRPLVPGAVPIDEKPHSHLPEFRLTSVRKSSDPETNYIEIMGQIYQLHDDGFFVLTWDFHRKKICYVPFCGAYPYPDEVEDFAWVKGKFDPKTRKIHLIEAEAIAFLEPKEAKQALQEIQAKNEKKQQKKAEMQEKQRKAEEKKQQKKAKEQEKRSDEQAPPESKS